MNPPPATRPLRLRVRLAAALGALAIATAALALASCGDRGGRAGGTTADPRERLSALLRRGAQPGELEVAERHEIERLVEELLPTATGALAGTRWRVAYDDLPVGDFISVDLLRGDGEAAERPVWLHLVWRGELSPEERARFVKTVGEYPARGVEDHHLFVRAGAVELRVVADSDEFRDAARLRGLVEAFDLDALARL